MALPCVERAMIVLGCTLQELSDRNKCHSFGISYEKSLDSAEDGVTRIALCYYCYFWQVPEWIVIVAIRMI